MSKGFEESLKAYGSDIERGRQETERTQRLIADRERERRISLQKTDGTDPKLILKDKTDYVLEFLRVMKTHNMPGANRLALPNDQPAVKISFFERLMGCNPGNADTILHGYPLGGQKNDLLHSSPPKNVVFICEDAMLRVYDIANFIYTPFANEEPLTVHNLVDLTIVVGETGTREAVRESPTGNNYTELLPAFAPTRIEHLLPAMASKYLS